VRLNVAVALLLVWVAGIVGLYPTDDRIHALLLVGLLLSLIRVLKARHAAAVRQKLDSRR
jgi:hypothetical protein